MTSPPSPDASGPGEVGGSGRGGSGALVAVAAVAGLLLLAGAILAVSAGGRAGAPVSGAGPLVTRVPGTGSGPAGDLWARASQAGVPVLDREGAVTHTHTLLRIYVENADETQEPVTVDAGIGIAPGGAIAAVHTHDDSGIVHVESPVADDTYTVGQFLTLWTGETDSTRICAAIASRPCHLFVTVETPTPRDREVLSGYGGVSFAPPAPPQGLDTVLAPGTVLGLQLQVDGPPTGEGPI